MIWHPESVKGHQLERLRLRLLQLGSKTPSKLFAMWDGQRLQQGTKSAHRTTIGRKLNTIARIKRRNAK